MAKRAPCSGSFDVIGSGNLGNQHTDGPRISEVEKDRSPPYSATTVDDDDDGDDSNTGITLV